MDDSVEGDGFEGLTPSEWFDRNAVRLYVASPDRLPCSSTLVGLQHKVAGLYFLRNAAGQTIYIGKSVDILARLHQHIDEGLKPFASAVHLEVEGFRRRSFFLAEIENAYIEALAPAYNAQQRPSAARDLVGAIRSAWAGHDVLRDLPIRRVRPAR